MKKNLFFASFMAFAATLFLVGCNNDEEDKDSYVFHQFDMYVKFESPVGTNGVDSLNLIALKKDSIFSAKPYNSREDDVVLTRCVRESDGFTIDIDRYNSHWLWFSANKNLYPALSGQGTLLQLRWIDPNIFIFEKAPAEEYDEAYTVYLKAPKIFGDDKERTIKWYVHVRRNIYNAYKCEVNGVEYNFTSRYDGPEVPQTEWLEVRGFVIPMPVNP